MRNPNPRSPTRPIRTVHMRYTLNISIITRQDYLQEDVVFSVTDLPV